MGRRLNSRLTWRYASWANRSLRSPPRGRRKARDFQPERFARGCGTGATTRGSGACCRLVVRLLVRFVVAMKSHSWATPAREPLQRRTSGVRHRADAGACTPASAEARRGRRRAAGLSARPGSRTAPRDALRAVDFRGRPGCRSTSRQRRSDGQTPLTPRSRTGKDVGVRPSKQISGIGRDG